MKQEVQEFLNKAEQTMLQDKLADVYVTDHKPVAKKFITLSEEEDAEYYGYI